MTEVSSLPTSFPFLKAFLSHLAGQNHTPLHALDISKWNKGDNSSHSAFILKSVHELRIIVNYIMRYTSNWTSYEDKLSRIIENDNAFTDDAKSKLSKLGGSLSSEDENILGISALDNFLESLNDDARRQVLQISETLVSELIGGEKSILLKGSLLVSKTQLMACVDVLLRTQLYRVFQVNLSEELVHVCDITSLIDFDWNVSSVTKSQNGREQLLCNLKLFIQDSKNLSSENILNYELSLNQLDHLLTQFNLIEKNIQDWNQRE